MVNMKRLLSLSAQALLLTKIRVDGPMLFRECVRLTLSLVKKYAVLRRKRDPDPNTNYIVIMNMIKPYGHP